MTHLRKSKPKQRSKWLFEALGTPWVIETDELRDDELCRVIKQRLDEYDQTYSRFREDSLISRLRQPGEYQFPADFPKLYGLYDQLYSLTDGKMTPLIGRTLEEMGYDAAYNLIVSETTPLDTLEATISWDGDKIITTQAPVVLDVGAAGKGYAVDIVSALLQDAHISNFTIDASGDLYHYGQSREIVGLEDPRDTSRVIGTVPLTNQALCASASNRRVWGDIHHIIDASTRLPIADVIATWVIAPEALIADGLATALFFQHDTSRLRQAFSFEYVRMWQDGTVDYSAGFGGELFI